jgi:hypothetical protein
VRLALAVFVAAAAFAAAAIGGVIRIGSSPSVPPAVVIGGGTSRPTDTARPGGSLGRSAVVRAVQDSNIGRYPSATRGRP